MKGEIKIMAITWLEKDIDWGANPSFRRSIGYEETGRTATQVTYKVYVKLKVQGSGASSSSYGYSIKWNIDGGSYSTMKESSPRWYGNEAYREFTKTITKSVTASGGSTTFKVGIVGGHGSSGSPNLSKTYTAKVSTFNTKPTWSSSARLTAREDSPSGAIITNELDGTENTKKIPENVGNIYLSWDGASDNESNVSKYELYNQVSESAWSLIYSGANKYFTHNIGSGASTQGRSYDYYVIAVDSYGEKSTSLNLRQFQKNTLTGATPTVKNGINYTTASTSVSWSGASNTNGNTSFTYAVSCNVTLYNASKVTSGGTIHILKSGTSTEPYILFEDIKNHVKGSGYVGNITFTLATTNAYGTKVTKTVNCSVDLKTDPKPPTSITVGGKVSTSLGAFLIPARSNAVVSWSGASDLLGGALTYDVYYKVGTATEVLATSGTPNTSIQVKLPTPTSATTVTFRVVAKTSYGRTASASNSAETIHYYNPPTVSIVNYNRTMTGATLEIHSALSTSIPSVKFAKQSYTGNGTTANFSGTKYTASLSGLNESSTFTFTATVNDNTGLSTDVSASFKVTTATPKFSVREKGVGVGCVNDGSEGILKVAGNVAITGSLKTNGIILPNSKKGIIQHTKTDGTVVDTLCITAGNNLRVGNEATPTYIYSSTNPLVNVGGTSYTIYHAGNKPTPADIGASPSSHTHSNYASSSHTHTGFSGAITFNRNTSTQAVIVHTQDDSNGSGDGQTHLGYYSNGAYHHYFRGRGTTHVNTTGGLSVAENITVSKNVKASGNVEVGSYAESFKSLIIYRNSNNQNYQARFGASYGSSFKPQSSNANTFLYGSVIEAHNGSSAVRRYLFSQQGLTPMSDNNTFLGTSSHRFNNVYASCGTVYSSSANEKADITPLSYTFYRTNESITDVIVDGIKNMNLYSYKYKALNSDDQFIGFLGQELEEQAPEFFNLIGSSYEREDTQKLQYDIREASVNGVLLAGLQQALKEIDLLKEEIKIMKGES